MRRAALGPLLARRGRDGRLGLICYYALIGRLWDTSVAVSGGATVLSRFTTRCTRWTIYCLAIFLRTLGWPGDLGHNTGLLLLRGRGLHWGVVSALSILLLLTIITEAVYLNNTLTQLL